MKNIAIVTTVVTTGLLSSAVFAETIYDGKNIYHTNATLADLQSEATRLNSYNHGNTIALQIHDGQIKDLQDTKVDKDVFTRDQIRQDEKLNEYGNRLDGYEASYSDLSSTVANYNTRLNSVEKNVKEAKESAAIALAVAGHQFNTDPEAGFQMALSGATTGGEQAIALGAGGAINRKWFVNAGVSKSGSTSGAVVSATYSFGR